MNVKDIQKALASLQFDVGPIDGIIGMRTRNAVKAFQKTANIPVDGIVGPITIAALHIATQGDFKIPQVKKPGATRAARDIHTLVWHCTATPEGRELTRQQIKDMHLKRGFGDIGYHKVIHLDGSVSEGRSEDKIGAHVAGHNTGTIGYSYVGGVDVNNKAKDTRTPAQKETMIRLTKEAIAKYNLRAVLGHRDLSPDLDGDGLIEPFEWVKQCPCFNVVPEYAPLFKR